MKVSLKLNRADNGSYEINVDVIGRDGTKHNFYRNEQFIENLYVEKYQDYVCLDTTADNGAVEVAQFMERLTKKYAERKSFDESVSEPNYYDAYPGGVLPNKG